MPTPHVAVILPCFNEAEAIARVVADFRAALPDATIYVFDNASTDATAAEATSAGAIVRRVRARGKGNVIRQAFAQIEAEVYVLADGDGTYDATRAAELIATLWQEQLDMVVGTRDHGGESDAYRSGHVAGNRLFNWIVQTFFGRAFIDIFSGYRVFSRPFVKSFPALATGFETETEMSLHALQLGLPCLEVATRYAPRVAGTASKLKTYSDGTRILWFIVRLLKHTRPLFLFAVLAWGAAVLSLGLGLPIAIEFVETGLVPRLPTAVVAASLMVIAAGALATGLILDGVAYTQRESKRLAYLSVSRRLPLRERPDVETRLLPARTMPP
jgi:glycosyltransferase involved in cell wall biosynthesis